MKKTLHQKAFPFHKIDFELTSQGLSVSCKSLFKGDCFFLKFEEIGIKRVYARKIRPRSILSAVLLTFLTVIAYLVGQTSEGIERYAYIFFLGMAAFEACTAILSYRKSFFLLQRNGANPIEFLVNKPSQKTVEAFVGDIIERRNKFLMEKFGQFNRLLSYEQQYHSLGWLADMDVLTNEEYLQKLDELNRVFSVSREYSGYQIYLN